MELSKLTVHELLEKIENKETTYKEVVSDYLEKIDKADEKIGAMLKVLKDSAIEKADKLDKDGAKAQGLTGIPYGLSDDICTLNIETTCASKMLYNFKPPYNATVVEKLEQAGSILLGKMNLDEFCMGNSTENSYFKTSKNPWDLEKVPGTISAAAGVAAGEVAFALGSDTGGAIRQSASFCGVVGLKPTYGLVSRYGLIAFASSLEQIGPITKDVRDSAIVLNAIAGHDPKDSTSMKVQNKDYTSYLTKDIKGLRIGVPKEYFNELLNPEVEKSVREAIEIFRELGAEIVDISLKASKYALPTYIILSSAEASSELARYDGLRFGYQAEEFDGLKDLYVKSRSQGFGDETKFRIMLGTYVLSSEHYDDYYKKALQLRTLIKQDFDEAFKDCDIVLSPTNPMTAFGLGDKNIEPNVVNGYTVSANIAGIPAISIPCGFDGNGLPIGLQLIGKAFEEEVILKAAYAYEQEAGHHTKRASL